jgi:thymidylate kinase
LTVLTPAQTPGIEGLASRLAKEAQNAGLLLCHWKSNQRLDLSVQGKTDLDMSIPPEQESRLRVLLKDLGFVEFRSRPWQRYAGVTDWLAVDPVTGIMLYLQLHTRLLTGAKAIKEQDLPWLELMNAEITPDPETGINIPPKAFEAHLLLTREAIKSQNLRGRILNLQGSVPVTQESRMEMTWLLNQCSEEEIEQWGIRLWGREHWKIMKPDFKDEILWSDAPFRRLTTEISASLAPYRRGSGLGQSVKFITMRLTKYLHTLRAWLDGTTISGKHVIGHHAPIIALVGSDGAGKSTVTADLLKFLSWKADATTVYFGTNHMWFRHLRNAVLRLKPNRKTDKPVNRPNRSSSAPRSRSSFPLWLQAVKWAIMARLRLHFQRKALRLSQNGTIVLADRYPQAEVTGTYDGPSRLDIEDLGVLGRLLQSYEHSVYKKLMSTQPDLVIKLIAPVEVALERKPDHDPDAIAAKVELTRNIKFGGAPIVEIDAAKPLNEVLLEVRRHVWSVIRATAEGKRVIP